MNSNIMSICQDKKPFMITKGPRIGSDCCCRCCCRCCCCEPRYDTSYQDFVLQPIKSFGTYVQVQVVASLSSSRNDSVGKKIVIRLSLYETELVDKDFYAFSTSLSKQSRALAKKNKPPTKITKKKKASQHKKKQ